MNDALDPLDALIAQLERAAEQLRSGELSVDAAATMVEDCASLATHAAAELDRRARAEVHPPLPGQDSLLSGQDSLLSGQDSLLSGQDSLL